MPVNTTRTAAMRTTALAGALGLALAMGNSTAAWRDGGLLKRLPPRLTNPVEPGVAAIAGRPGTGLGVPAVGSGFWTNNDPTTCGYDQDLLVTSDGNHARLHSGSNTFHARNLRIVGQSFDSAQNGSGKVNIALAYDGDAEIVGCSMDWLLSIGGDDAFYPLSNVQLWQPGSNFSAMMPGMMYITPTNRDLYQVVAIGQGAVGATEPTDRTGNVIADGDKGLMVRWVATVTDYDGFFRRPNVVIQACRYYARHGAYNSWINLLAMTVSSLSCSGTTATATVNSTAGISVGDTVTVSIPAGGVTAYGGQFTVLSIPDGTHFTYAVTTAGLATSSIAGVTATATNTNVRSHVEATAYSRDASGVITLTVPAHGIDTATVSRISVGYVMPEAATAGGTVDPINQVYTWSATTPAAGSYRFTVQDSNTLLLYSDASQVAVPVASNVVPLNGRRWLVQTFTKQMAGQLVVSGGTGTFTTEGAYGHGITPKCLGMRVFGPGVPPAIAGNNQTLNIVSLTAAGTTTATATVASTASLQVGDAVFFQGSPSTLSGFNGSWTIASIVDATHFTVTLAAAITGTTAAAYCCHTGTGGRAVISVPGMADGTYPGLMLFAMGGTGSYGAHADPWQVDNQSHYGTIEQIDVTDDAIGYDASILGLRFFTHTGATGANYAYGNWRRCYGALPHDGGNIMFYLGETDQSVSGAVGNILPAQQGPRTSTLVKFFQQCWVELAKGEAKEAALYPQPGTTINGVQAGPLYGWDAILAAIFAYYPAITAVQGRLYFGAPPGGDFAPWNKVGINFVSPGYEGALGAVAAKAPPPAFALAAAAPISENAPVYQILGRVDSTDPQGFLRVHDVTLVDTLGDRLVMRGRRLCRGAKHALAWATAQDGTPYGYGLDANGNQVRVYLPQIVDTPRDGSSTFKSDPRTIVVPVYKESTPLPPSTATLSPTDKSSTITLSNGNLEATTSTTGSQLVRATKAITGKTYFEVQVGGVTSSANGKGAVGLATTSQALNTIPGGSGASGIGINYQGQVNVNNVGTAAGATSGGTTVANTYGAGSVLCFAVDPVNMLMWVKNGANGIWSNNGTTSGAGDPVAGTGGFAIPSGALTPAVGCRGTGDDYLFGFDGGQWLGVAPAGYGAL